MLGEWGFVEIEARSPSEKSAVWSLGALPGTGLSLMITTPG
jgi:hypothetical protein